MKLFVYGTLKRNHRLNSWLTTATYLKDSIIPGLTLYDLGSYPFAFPSGDKQITGEIWEVGEDTLDLLDMLEFGAGFKREERSTEEGDKVQVYLWEASEPYKGAKEIEDGTWRKS